MGRDMIPRVILAAHRLATLGSEKLGSKRAKSDTDSRVSHKLRPVRHERTCFDFEFPL